MMTMTPEKAQALLDEKWFYGDEAAPDLARAYIAQAAELTRLRAKVAAGDKLADWIEDGSSWDALYAALDAYREAGK